MRKSIFAAILAITILVNSNCHGQLQKTEWPNYGNDPGGQRFSPLTQVDTSNVHKLKTAWTYRTGELQTYEGSYIAEKAAFEATPLMVDGVLYFSTPTNRVIAIHAENGKEKWVYDPRLNLKQEYSEVTSRGVSRWIDSAKKPGEPGYMRILVATIDGRLIALDAETGQPVSSFGENGIVDLKKGIGRIQVTSPPAVINDIIVVGSTMGDNTRIDFPPGVVRAFDARSGKMIWSWDPIPRDAGEPGYETWQGNTRPGAANAWAPISADPLNGLVYVPTSCPSTDYYGGERKGSNLFANSLVALNAATGKMAWHFQAVHHDIWDYDLPAQPILTDVTKDGKKIPVVILVTKMGHIFVLDRKTGEHIFPIEERAVPSSDVAGEEAYPTQPFPVKLPALGLQTISPEDAWGPTAESKQKAEERIKSLQYKGIFTPPSTKGSIITPGNVGGMNWSGASFDPNNHLLVTNVNRLAAVITLHPKTETSRKAVNTALPRAEVAPQDGTPYILSREYLFNIENGDFLMQTRPPWGTLAAVDLQSGQLKWEVPLGFQLDPRKYPGAENWGSVNLGGAITTAGGLAFVAATMDGHLRAFNIETGKMMWQTALPAGGQATPMTYAWKGKQYIVIAAGGHGKLGTKLGDYVIAYALD